MPVPVAEIDAKSLIEASGLLAEGKRTKLEVAAYYLMRGSCTLAKALAAASPGDEAKLLFEDAREAAEAVEFLSREKTRPIVRIAQPLDGAAFTAPATVAIWALASDRDGFIKKVRFLHGSEVLGEDTEGADGWSLVWKDAPAGSYSLIARATDNGGVAACTEDRTGGDSKAGNAAVFWEETESWGTVYLSPFQTSVVFRFGTTQRGNAPMHKRPSSVGSSFSMSVSIKNGTTDSLFVDGIRVVEAGGKREAITACHDTGNLGRGNRFRNFYPGLIAEVLVYARALPEAERERLERHLRGRYFTKTGR